MGILDFYLLNLEPYANALLLLPRTHRHALPEPAWPQVPLLPLTPWSCVRPLLSRPLRSARACFYGRPVSLTQEPGSHPSFLAPPSKSRAQSLHPLLSHVPLASTRPSPFYPPPAPRLARPCARPEHLSPRASSQPRSPHSTPPPGVLRICVPLACAPLQVQIPL